MGFNTVTTVRSGPVLNAIINDGEINLLHWRLQSDLNDLLDSIQNDPDLKVLVFSSSNPDFFIAHLDLAPRAGALLTVLKSLSLMDEKYNLNPVLEAALSVSRKLFSQSSLPMMHPLVSSLGYFFGVMYRIRTLPICTIALLTGRCRGGGNDFATACDMRFGLPSTIMGAPEVAVGLYAAGGAGRRMFQIMGAGLAAQYLFSGEDIDAPTAERTGLLNRVFESQAEMERYVGTLSQRIGKFNLPAVRATKGMLTDEKVILRDMERDWITSLGLLEDGETRRRMAGAMEMVKGGIHCEAELNLAEALMELYD